MPPTGHVSLAAMAEKRGLSPEPVEELDGDTGAVVAKRQRTDEGQLVVGSVTKEVRRARRGMITI